MNEVEIFSPNKAIDTAIKEMLPGFDESSQNRMKKSIHNAGKAAKKYQDENTDAGARHKFREFIPAYVLNMHGYALKYDVKIEGKTPDWLDNEFGLMIESLTFERGGSSPFPSRVYSSVAEKCVKYTAIAHQYSFLIVVAVYLDFLTCIDFDDCYSNREAFRPLFEQYQRLAGILFFTEQNSGFPIGGQHYGFYCLTSEDRLASHSNWPFCTVTIDND